MQTARLKTHSAKIKSHQAKHTLNQLHAELVGKIIDNKKGVERLRQAMEHVEAVIKLLDPSFNIRSIAIRRRKQNPWFKRGTLFRGALVVLRQADKPLTTNEIVTSMIAAKASKSLVETRCGRCSVRSRDRCRTTRAMWSRGMTTSRLRGDQLRDEFGHFCLAHTGAIEPGLLALDLDSGPFGDFFR